MYITMLKRLSTVALISISLASCGGTATDTSSVTEYLNAINDIPANDQGDNPDNTIDNLAPTAPGGVQFSSVTSTGLTLSWSASSDNIELAGYRVYRNGSLVSTTQSLSFSDAALSASTDYSYVVQAYDSSNNTASSNTQNITTQAASTSAQAITVSWQDPTRNTDNSCLDELEGYTLHYGTSSGSYNQTAELQVTSGDVSCTQTDYDNACSKSVMTCSYVTEQLPADTWYFAIQTYDTQGSLSGYSNEVVKIIN